MIAAVLWLGNIEFTVIDNENDVQAVEDEGKNRIESLGLYLKHLLSDIHFSIIY